MMYVETMDYVKEGYCRSMNYRKDGLKDAVQWMEIEIFGASSGALQKKSTDLYSGRFLAKTRPEDSVLVSFSRAMIFNRVRAASKHIATPYTKAAQTGDNGSITRSHSIQLQEKKAKHVPHKTIRTSPPVHFFTSIKPPSYIHSLSNFIPDPATLIWYTR